MRLTIELKTTWSPQFVFVHGIRYHTIEHTEYLFSTEQQTFVFVDAQLIGLTGVRRVFL